MFLNITDKKTGESITLDIHDYNVDSVFELYEYINNINDFNFNIQKNDND